MTSPRSPYSQRSTATESISDWAELHSKQVTLGVVVLIAAVGGVWFYGRSQDLKAERADRAYYAAQGSIASGNLPLAESDLKKLVNRYEGTDGAMQGRLLLAQILYEQGKHQEGVNQLVEGEKALGGSDEFEAPGYLVLAAGYEQLKKFGEAGAAYEKAAAAARFEPDRHRYQSFAARAYQLAGKPEEAKRLWTPLAADSKSVVAGEARVRLGEMTVKAQSKS